jgi:hypothetical protein
MDEFIQSGDAQNSVPGEILSVLQKLRDQAMLTVQGDMSQVQSVN